MGTRIDVVIESYDREHNLIKQLINNTIKEVIIKLYLYIYTFDNHIYLIINNSY